MSSKVISFRIPDDLYGIFDSKCTENGSNTTDMLRKLVIDYCCPKSTEIKKYSEPVAVVKGDEPMSDSNTSLGVLVVRVEALEKALWLLPSHAHDRGRISLARLCFKIGK